MRVLIIEDEHKIANALKRVFQQEHYAVDVCYDGEEGLTMGTNQPYDIMIIDLGLPKKDGLEVIKELRQQSVHTPVIVLTAKGSTSEKVAGLDAGADDYILKPFAMDEVLARVRALLRRPADQQTTVLEAEDLTLNTTTYEVKRGGKVIPLTSKEFSLLEYLLRNKARPLSKDEIIGHVWDYDADVLPNTVEVYIRYLRQKIDDPFNKPIIHTARGFGYSVKE